MKLDEQKIQSLTRLFAQGHHCLFASTTPSLNIVHDDPDDDKFIECAVALDCKVIVSGDKHLKAIKQYVDIQILSPRQFIEQYNN